MLRRKGLGRRAAELPSCRAAELAERPDLLPKPLARKHSDEDAIGHEVALPHAARLLEEAIEPLQSEIQHEEWRSFRDPRQHVERAAHTVADRHAEGIPALLKE